MLCTAVYDAYRDDERAEIHEALTSLASAGQPDWSPQGVYAYWDPASHRILYLGLTKDIAHRFAQHNGLVHHSGGNKSTKVNEYFADHECLGFTVLLQSKAIMLMEQVRNLDVTMGSTASGTIAVAEGQLIEMHRLVYGTRPPWNSTGGSGRGKRYATSASALLEVLAAARQSLFAARRPLRTVVADLRIRLFEATIHASRMRAVMEANGLAKLPEPNEAVDVGKIERSIMMRDGRLLADLDASDEDIRRWVIRLGDPQFWREEARAWQAVFERDHSVPSLTSSEQAVLALLNATVAGGATPQHVAASGGILQSGYLNERVVIPSS